MSETLEKTILIIVSTAVILVAMVIYTLLYPFIVPSSHPTITATSTESNEAVFKWTGSERLDEDPSFIEIAAGESICSVRGECFPFKATTTLINLSEAIIRTACGTDIKCWSVLEKYAK